MIEPVKEALENLPSWVGSLPAWTTLIVVIGYIALQWMKNQPVMSQQAMEERLNIKEGYRDTIRRLESRVEECHKESREREAAMQEEIDTLKMRLSNEALQRIQSEISLVQTLIQIVPDAQQLKAIMAGLESRQVRMIKEEQARLVIKGAGDEIEGA